MAASVDGFRAVSCVQATEERNPMPVSQLKILGRVFEAEIEGRIFQPSKRNKLILDLLQIGAVEQVEFNISGHFKVHVKGFALTHSGRFTYCEWASRQKEPK